MARPADRQDAVPYVYPRKSARTGKVTWYGDYRRFADVGGKQEALAKYTDGSPIQSQEEAQIVYWRRVEHYLAERSRRDSARKVEDAARPVSRVGSVVEPTQDSKQVHLPESALTASTNVVDTMLAEAGLLQKATPTVYPAVGSSRLPITSSVGNRLPSNARVYGRAETDQHSLRPATIARGKGDMPLREAVDQHLKRKGKPTSRSRDSTVERDERALSNVVAFFGASRPLDSITAADLDEYIEMRLSEPGQSAGTTVSVNTIRNELFALSNVYRKLRQRGELRCENPVSLIDIPPPPDLDIEFLEVDEVGPLLDVAAEMDAETQRFKEGHEILLRVRSQGVRGRRASSQERAMLEIVDELYPLASRAQNAHRRYPHIEALLTVFFYTGGRRSEVLGLEVRDLDFQSSLLHFRGRKTAYSARKVELWPDLRRVLEWYLNQAGITDGLLFPGEDGKKKMYSIDSWFRRAIRRAGVTKSFTPHGCRHTYATALLNTVVATGDGQYAQRSSWDVAKHLGHRDSEMVDEVYGHVAKRPVRMRELSFDAWRRLPTTRLETSGKT